MFLFILLHVFIINIPKQTDFFNNMLVKYTLLTAMLKFPKYLTKAMLPNLTAFILSTDVYQKAVVISVEENTVKIEDKGAVVILNM